MADFGETLRALRIAAGWRQVDFVRALNHQVARSTLANIETGRERPTPKVWHAICALLPEWAGPLEDGYLEARYEVEQGRDKRRVVPAAEGRRSHRSLVEIEEVRYIYNFRFSRSPEEILEIRKVRARERGVTGFDLQLTQSRHEGFRVEEECLWGGDVTDATFTDAEWATTYVRRVDFGRSLRRGQAHIFAVRSWVAVDPQPDTNINADFTVPCRRFTFQLNFWGHERPQRLWRYGPVPKGSVADDGRAAGRRLPLSRGGAGSITFRDAEPGLEYGVGWIW